MSTMRLKYKGRLVMRCVMAAAALAAYIFRREMFLAMSGMEFFRKLTLLHLCWFVWMCDMLLQIVPVRPAIAIGSLKQFGRYYVPGKPADEDQLRGFVRKSDVAAARVFAVWAAVAAAIGTLVLLDVIGRAEIFLICMFFYVCDLICVLFWCPFRVFLMKNRCCTTCRIFNWDHIMMFVPFVFSGGFYGLSLFAMSVLVFVVWEAAYHLHPERFWERTNASLRCSQCSDVLCGHTDHKLKL